LTEAAQDAPDVAEELAGVGEFPPGASDTEKVACLGSWVRLLVDILLDQQRSIDRRKRTAVAEAAALGRICQAMDLQSRVVAEVASRATGVDFEAPDRVLRRVPIRPPA
jgi:hypothetical protein